MANDDHPSGE
jgi:hypothetical protein